MTPVLVAFFLSLSPEAREGKRGRAPLTAGPAPTRCTCWRCHP